MLALLHTLDRIQVGGTRQYSRMTAFQRGSHVDGANVAFFEAGFLALVSPGTHSVQLAARFLTLVLKNNARMTQRRKADTSADPHLPFAYF